MKTIISAIWVMVSVLMTQLVWADIDYAARPSLSAEESFKMAQKIDGSREAESNLSQMEAEAGIYYAEQAIEKGYKNVIEAKLLLQRFLFESILPYPECQQTNHPKNHSQLLNKCKPVFATAQRAINIDQELYKDYPDNPIVANRYITSSFAKNLTLNDKAEILKKALRTQPNNQEIVTHVGTILLEEKKYEEAKNYFIKAIELITEKWFLADQMERYVDYFGGECVMPKGTDQAIQSIPERYKQEYDSPKGDAAPEEIADSKKLAEITQKVIKGIRNAKCEMPDPKLEEARERARRVRALGGASEISMNLMAENKNIEAKSKIIEALGQISDEYELANAIFVFTRILDFDCPLPKDTQAAVDAIPARFLVELKNRNNKPKSAWTPVELDDSKKLAEIKQRVINGISQIQCKK